MFMLGENWLGLEMVKSVWEFSVLSAQHFYKPKIALKIKYIFGVKKAKFRRHVKTMALCLRACHGRKYFRGL